MLEATQSFNGLIDTVYRIKKEKNETNVVSSYEHIISNTALANDANDPSKFCLLEIVRNPTFQPLAGKIALINAKEQTFDMLTNTSKPSKLDKKLISQWVAELERCMKLGEAYRVEYLPKEIQELINAYSIDFLATTADLHSSKITYGEYAKLRAVKVVEFEKKNADFIQEIKRNNEQLAEQERQRAEEQDRQRRMLAQQQEQNRQMLEQQEEQMRRQAALQLLMNNQRQYQAPVIQPYQIPNNSTIHTNCNTYGSQTICTTR